jgi:DNA repair protein RecO (recombination protein O)
MTRALVVGCVDYGDADRVVRLLTEDGRIDAFAPGARRSRKRFGGALESLQSIDADLHRRTRGEGLITLRSATVVAARLSLRQDLERIALGSYAAELGLSTAPEGQRSPVHGQVVELLDTLPLVPVDQTLRRAFELRLLPGLGYEPELRGCVACGVVSDPATLDFRIGGRLCDRHGPLAEGRRRVGPRTLAWCRALVSGPTLEPHAELGPEGAARAARAVGPVLDAFYRDLLERPLRSGRLVAELGL